MIMDNNSSSISGARIPEDRQGGTTVPGPPRSGSCTKTGNGPQPGRVLPAGTQPGAATADVETGVRSPSEDRVVRGIVEEVLRPPSSAACDIPSDDAMSVVSEGTSKRKFKQTLSDSDADDQIRRGGKILRSRVIESDSDKEPVVVLSDSPENLAKVRKKKKGVICNREVDLDGSVNLSSFGFTPCPVRLTSNDLNSKSADEISGIAYGWLNDVELARFKSKKLNCRISGCIRDRVECLRSVVKTLVDRAKDAGDLSYLRRRNDELAAQLRESKKEEGRLKSLLKESDVKNGKLNSEIQLLRRRVGSSSADSVGPRQDTPRRTPRKEPLTKRDVRKESSIVESLQDCDDRLNAIAKCDERITKFEAKFEAILRQLRSDLYGSVETLEEQITNVVDPPKRVGPRIISDVQLVPPRSMGRQESEPIPQHDPVFADFENWITVTDGRRGKKQVRIESNGLEGPSTRRPSIETENLSRRPPPSSSTGVRRRAPRKAAVAVKINPGETTLSYSDVMKKAKEQINLRDLGISNINSHRTANGSVIIEIPGPEGHIKADTLATRLREIIGENAVISRPVVKADLRIVGFDDSVIKEEVITMITDIGGCLAGEVRVGQFRPTRNGSNMTWVQCPLSAAIRVSRKGRVNLGWSIARAELMKAKPVQCYKCWNFGHVRNKCSSSVDRTGHCFRCGDKNHTSYTCSAEPHCVICADAGLSSDHRLGTPACLAMARGSGGDLRKQ